MEQTNGAILNDNAAENKPIWSAINKRHEKCITFTISRRVQDKIYVSGMKEEKNFQYALNTVNIALFFFQHFTGHPRVEEFISRCEFSFRAHVVLEIFFRDIIIVWNSHDYIDIFSSSKNKTEAQYLFHILHSIFLSSSKELF